jgi:dienelactone hydrolase
MAFLRPSGPYHVGSIMHELVDADRPSNLKNDTAGRRLLIKAWYPADPTTATGMELLWEQLREDPQTPLPVRLVLGCVRKRTSTYRKAHFNADVPASSVVVYNHGLISFASENTSLMEELASHGQIVISIQHAEQLLELRALSGAQSAEKKKVDASLMQKLRSAPQSERAKLGLEYCRASTNTNRIVVERSIDTSFVLDRIEDVLAQIPGLRAQSIEKSAGHLVGFSVGGAVSWETAKRDSRARSVINLDGGMHGTLDATELRVPYLMMYSSANDGSNDELLPSSVTRLVRPDTTHLNYHDIAALLPVLRYVRLTGRTNAKSFLAYRNQIVREFLSRTAQPADDPTASLGRLDPSDRILPRLL